MVRICTIVCFFLTEELDVSNNYNYVEKGINDRLIVVYFLFLLIPGLLFGSKKQSIIDVVL